MHATAIVEGKVIRFKLSPALARAHRENRGKTVTERAAVAFVETKRRGELSSSTSLEARRVSEFVRGCKPD